MCAEAETLWNTADWLAECEAAHSLAEATGTDGEKKELTFAKVTIGPDPGSWNQEEYTREELETKLIEFQLWVPIDGGKTVVQDAFETDETGTFLLSTRRIVRDAELDDKRDLYLFFLDRIAALEHELLQWFATGRNNPRLVSVTRQQGPAFGSLEDLESQGEYIFTLHSIEWGDPIASAE